MSEARYDDLPTFTIEEPKDPLERVLRDGQLLLLKHPLAAQALFRAFVAEGRRFGETEEGRRWRDALADSDLIRRGRVVWEVATLKLLEERSPTLLPSKLLDAFLEASREEHLEPMLARLFDPGDERAATGPADPE